MTDVYLDYNATAPTREESRDAWERTARECFANPSSAHAPGRRAKAALDSAREELAEIIGARPGEILFTSGGTESDNMALKGVALRAGAGHVVTSAIEHPAVLETCRFLERECFELTCVGSRADGTVDVSEIADVLTEDTLMVSLMWVNNETGVIQPVKEVARLTGEANVLFHSDAVQAFGRVAIDVKDAGVDLLSVSGHKFGAPRGTGALFVRKGVRLEAVIHGGGQEWNMRSGTQNVAGAVALVVAARLAENEREAEARRLTVMRDRLESMLTERIPDVHVNGAGAKRVANTSNVRIDGADGEAVLLGLDEHGVAASSASACAASREEPSHVLMAMGLTRRQAEDSMRFSLGRGTTEVDITRLVEVLPAVVERARAARPTR